MDGVEQKTWTLDALGNDMAAGTYNAVNEETPDEGYSGYDAAGNMTTLQSGKTAVYDAWNRLVEVDDGESIVQQNEYDGANRRIQVFTDFDGSTPDKVVDEYLGGQQVIESDVTVDGDRDGGYQMIWSPRYIDAAVLRDTLNTAGTGIVAAQRVFYLSDANYNVTGLVKYDSGTEEWQVAERNTYTPYGVATYRNPDWTTAGSSANSNTILYTGRTLDLPTSLYYYRARYYDAGLERFIGKDPIVYKGGDVNLYRYCHNRPLAYTDPFGLEGRPLTGLPDALRAIARSEVCKAEAERIAAAIQYTWNENATWGFLGIGRLRETCGRSERECGYFCYEWAYAFARAAIHESSGCFQIEVQQASVPGDPEGRVHYWVKITSTEDRTKYIFVDDGFSGGFVHAHYPLPHRYRYNPKQLWVKPERGVCEPPPAYNSRGKPLYLLPEMYDPPTKPSPSPLFPSITV